MAVTSMIWLLWDYPEMPEIEIILISTKMPEIEIILISTKMPEIEIILILMKMRRFTA